jgi:hypothetical protein
MAHVWPASLEPSDAGTESPFGSVTLAVHLAENMAVTPRQTISSSSSAVAFCALQVKEKRC